MSLKEAPQNTVIYYVRRHPLEWQKNDSGFEWLEVGRDQSDTLKEMLGEFDPEIVEFKVDEEPAGKEWLTLLQDLVDDKIDRVITHLAPLSSAQRQQLIGICSEVGAHLVTPSDAGRNRLTRDRLH